jgi:hypothetical protein
MSLIPFFAKSMSNFSEDEPSSEQVMMLFSSSYKTSICGSLLDMHETIAFMASNIVQSYRLPQL